jgi:UDP-hydrolysing UDP-N-acetyl-D-glucosamine 2-epimerase
MKKKIAIYSGGRADYHILKPLIKKLSLKNNTYLIAGPHHFAKEFGYTYREIVNDQIKIFNKRKINLDYKNINVPKFIQSSVLHYQFLLKKINPKLTIVLGDRYELLSFCLAAFFLNIKIIHLHGGEKTEGSFDDTIRHLITKLSHYHFVCSEKYAQRVRQMGENQKNIYNFGSIGAFNTTKVKLIKKSELKNIYKIERKLKLILVTFHPETNSILTYKKQILILLKSLKKIKKTFIIFTSSNGDPGGIIFNQKIKEFVKKNINCLYIPTMGEKLYFSFMKHCDLMIGNSSSGIIESPLFNTRVINVGSRQTGRITALNTFNVPLNIQKIYKISIKLLKTKKTKKIKNPFYKKNSLKIITNKIESLLKEKKDKFKVFND